MDELRISEQKGGIEIDLHIRVPTLLRYRHASDLGRLPSVGFGGFHLKDIEDRGKKFSQGLVKDAKAFVNNTKQDIQLIINKVTDCVHRVGGAAENCLQDLEDINKRLEQRAAEYTTDIVQLGAELVPYDFIAEVYQAIFGSIQRPANGQVWRLKNPHQTFWTGSLNDAVVEEVELETYVKGERAPIVFVHGLNYSIDNTPGKPWHDALTIFVNDFEQGAKIFANGDHAGALDLLFVTWDTIIKPKDRDIILAGIPGNPIDDGVGFVIWGVYWKELERRARELADYLQPFFLKMMPPRQGGGGGRVPFVVTHSLGSYVWSFMINRMWTTTPIRAYYAGDWWTMEAAVLNTAFDPEGDFPNVPQAYDNGDMDIPIRITVWYSQLDAVLATAYVWANLGIAMGSVGANTGLPDYTEADVTTLADGAHGETQIGNTGAYFKLIASQINSAIPEYIRFPER